MIKLFTTNKNTIRQFAWLMLLFQISGLFYCGEKDCFHGENDDACQTMLCSSMDNLGESQQTSPHPQEDACHCMCQITYNIHSAGDLAYFFTVEIFADTQPAVRITLPPFGIDHIPRA